MSQNKLGVSTGTNVTTNQVKHPLEDKIYLFDPTESTLCMFLQKLGDSNPGDPEFSHVEDDLCADRSTITNNATTGTTITVPNKEYFSIGDLIFVPSTDELMRVDAAVTGSGSGNLSVVRGVGAGAAVSIDGSGTAVDIIIIGNAFMEGGTLPDAKFRAKTEVENYTQIFKTVLPGITRTMEKSKQNTEDEWAYQKRKYGIEHAFLIEKTAFFGHKDKDSNGNHPLRTTGGLVERISTNVMTGVGTLSEGILDHWLYDWLQYAKRPYLFASPLIHRAICQFAKNKGQVMQGATKYGVNIDTYMVAGGQVKVVMHKRLLQGAFGGYAIGVDLENIQQRTLDKTHFVEKLQANDEDQKSGYFLTETGFSWKHEKTHALMTGVTAMRSTSSS